MQDLFSASQNGHMFFLPEQVAEYEKKRMTVREILQLQLFVIDEASAIQWLNRTLTSPTFKTSIRILKELGAGRSTKAWSYLIYWSRAS